MAEKPCGKNDSNSGADSPSSDTHDPDVTAKQADGSSSDESCLKTLGVANTCLKKATTAAAADREAQSDSDSGTEPNDPICLKKVVAPGSASGSDADGEMSAGDSQEGDTASDVDQAQEEPVAVKQKKKNQRAQTKAGWNLSEDGKLRGMKEGGASWVEIAKAVRRDPGECWERWEELQLADSMPSSKTEEISILGLGQEGEDVSDDSDEERQQHEYLLQHIWPALYGDAGVGPGPILDVASTAALDAVRRRADRIRLLELQAALANEIGRVIPLEIIATTLERSEG